MYAGRQTAMRRAGARTLIQAGLLIGDGEPKAEVERSSGGASDVGPLDLRGGPLNLAVLAIPAGEAIVMAEAVKDDNRTTLHHIH